MDERKEGGCMDDEVLMWWKTKTPLMMMTVQQPGEIPTLEEKDNHPSDNHI